jgi:chromosome segregation ATPase
VSVDTTQLQAIADTLKKVAPELSTYLRSAADELDELREKYKGMCDGWDQEVAAHEATKRELTDLRATLDLAQARNRSASLESSALFTRLNDEIAAHEATKRELEEYKRAVTDQLHYDMKAVLTGTPENRVANELTAERARRESAEAELSNYHDTARHGPYSLSGCGCCACRHFARYPLGKAREESGT